MNYVIEVKYCVANNSIYASEPKKQLRVPQVMICLQQREKFYNRAALHLLQWNLDGDSKLLFWKNSFKVQSFKKLLR